MNIAGMIFHPTTVLSSESSSSSSVSSSSMMMTSPMFSLTTVLITGCVTVVLLSALFVVQRESKKRKDNSKLKRDFTSSGKTNEIKIDPTKYPAGLVTIYYATQTGTAESFAQQLEREGPDYGFYIHSVDMEQVTEVKQFLNQPSGNCQTTPRIIILAATYGEGEPTDNATSIVQALQAITTEIDENDNSASAVVKGLEYCVFGLGNKQYEHYNAMGKLFDEGLKKLGGTQIMPIGMGDDDADLEGDFETWKDQMWSTFQKKYCKDGDATDSKMDQSKKHKKDEYKLPECEYEIEYHISYDSTTSTITPKEIPHDQVHGSSRPYFTAVECPVTIVRELRSSEDGGSTKHIEIDVSKYRRNHDDHDNINNSKSITYETADNLGVLPLNEMDVVESVAKSLKYDLDAVFSIKAAKGHEWHGAPFPMPLTVRDCLRKHLDLTSAPRRSDLKLLIPYATDPIDRKALIRLSSKEGKQEYKEKIMEGFVGMVDLLKLCPSLSIPLEHFVSICHFLLPRYYTISSSSSVHPSTVHLTVAVTRDQRKDGSSFYGVCSTYLSKLNPDNNDTVFVFNRPSTFRLPKDTARPIIMIGPGTGVAPMRALLQERQYQKTVKKEKVGANVLYFGCKKRTLDYLYREELEAFEKEGILDKFYTAFSREQVEKVYVQNLLLQNGKETWKLIDSEHASIYVCGGVKMGHDVMEALKEITSTHGEMSFNDAKDYLAKLTSEGRFVQELWA